MILGIGLISLATLFPIGLLRLRQAHAKIAVRPTSPSRRRRHVEARNLFAAGSFAYADLLNVLVANTPVWYPSVTTIPRARFPTGSTL